MGRLLFFAFLAIPLIEIGLFIVIGQAIGVWLTLLGVLVIAAIGSAIIRHQGLSLLAEIRGTFQAGQMPARSIAEAMMVGIAGVFMVVPGYFTDALGLLLLVPPIRALIYTLITRRLGRPTAPGGTTKSPGWTPPGERKPSRLDDRGTIDLNEDDFRHRR